VIDVDSLPDSIGVSYALLRYAGVPTPTNAPAKVRGKDRGEDLERGKCWTPNQIPECPVYLGYWICQACERCGFDLRMIMCPFELPTEEDIRRGDPIWQENAQN
jgi:hypothetical protein